MPFYFEVKSSKRRNPRKWACKVEALDIGSAFILMQRWFPGFEIAAITAKDFDERRTGAVCREAAIQVYRARA